MKLEFHGHDERYVAEQSLMNLFPGERPVYEPITPDDGSWAVISLREDGDRCAVRVELAHGGRTGARTYEEVLSGSDFDREGQRRHAIGACFFLAARDITGVTPPWGMLTGVRPDKPVTWALEAGRSPEEAKAFPCARQYAAFTAAYRGQYVYEMMRLGLEATPFRSLAHIAGVHFVAMSAARDLHRNGLPVDLALVSGSSIGHDIGKFGCRPGERVPYLHYYYTDQWFRRLHLDAIGHIAANHSVWDLELDNLSVEGLLLIYADFRVKQERDPDGSEIAKIYSLKDSYDVILSKLDNVDDAKRQRYAFVYEKLRIFEQYMENHGVDTALEGRLLSPAPQPDIVLMDDEAVVDGLCLAATDHSLHLMRRLSDQRSFAAIVEEARGETNWQQLRAYLGVFETYSVYLNAAQKQLMLSFLYEQLMHREGDIRRQAAHLMGDILANFHAGYAKEVPVHHRPDPNEVTGAGLTREYLQKILYPDHRLLLQHRRWLHYTLKMVMSSLLEHCGPARTKAVLSLLLECYQGQGEPDDVIAFTLLDAAGVLPLDACTAEQLTLLTSFAAGLSRREAESVQAAALELLVLLAREESCREAALDALEAARPRKDGSCDLLRRQAVAYWRGSHSEDVIAALEEDDISDIFLENLKAGTPWIVKKANIRILTDFARLDHDYHLLHIATHLSNLLMVSEQVTVRLTAGSALLSIAPLLSFDQRSEVAVELGRGLETGQQEFSKYIPDFLGPFLLYLPPSQLEERLTALGEAQSSPNSTIAAGALATVGVLYEHYGTYRSRFLEEEDVFLQRRERLLGMLLKGLAAFHDDVRHEALQVIGDRIFGSLRLSEEEKRQTFTLAAKKLLFLLYEDLGGELTFFYRAAALLRVFRFITAQRLLGGGFRFPEPRNIAFFPGTFDPFTLSHKGIVQAMLDLGFEVMLAIDEFSWSKRTQPHRVRRRIAALSTADLFHVHIFPEHFPVNIANPENLQALREAFPGREVYLAVGSDVITGASSYRAAPEPHSVHTFSHILFRRNGQTMPDLSLLQGKVVELRLPPHLEAISSTRIRNAIDANRDISHLIDPVAQGYIYRHNLYLREPMNKPVLEAESLTFRVHEYPDDHLFRALCEGPLAGRENALDLCGSIRRQRDSVITLRREKDRTIRGFVSLKCLDSHELFSRLGDTRLSAYVRQNAGGKALVISSIYVRSGEGRDACQLLLTEALTYALRREYTYAFCCPFQGSFPPQVREVLTLQGFVPSPAAPDGREVLVVDMRNPIVLSRNLDTVIKAPMVDAPRVREAVDRAHRRLQRTLTSLYPGSLVLSLSAATLHRRLVGRIAACNGVSVIPTQPRVLGECICVPFGKILRGAVVPNTVTKTLHTDKVYETDLSAYSIEAFTGYSPFGHTPILVVIIGRSQNGGHLTGKESARILGKGRPVCKRKLLGFHLGFIIKDLGPQAIFVIINRFIGGRQIQHNVFGRSHAAQKNSQRK